MPGLEQFARERALELLFEEPATPYVALMQSLPLGGVGGVEVSASEYARQLVTKWSTIVQVNATRREAIETVSFGTFSSVVVVQGWAVFDAIVAGNLLASGDIIDTGFGQFGTITVPIGDELQFQAGQFAVTIGECTLVQAPL